MKDIPKILVIDDEPDFQDIIRQVLEPEGYALLQALDGAAGLEMLRRERPDLVVLDLNLPGKDGYAVCREIRSDEEFADTPIVMITIRGRDAEIIQGLECGADDYLPKPFKPRELANRIRNLLRRA